MAMISWAGKWPAYTYGAEISLLDLIVLGIFLSLPRRQHPLPFKFPIGFYFFAVILSVYQASVPEAALFYVWQLARIFFIYIVISTASAQDPRVSPALLKGMAFGLILGLCEALWERFGLGILRTHGGFSHENLFGVVSHFVVYPFFALLLAGERGWLAPVISLAGIIIAALTASRATFALAVFGYGVVFIASTMRGWNSRKTKVAAISFIAVLAVAPLVVSSFQDRFQSGAVNAFFGTDEARVAMARAASMMLADHPMGVGPNHFIVVANNGGYYSQVKLPWTDTRAFVHNAYWLVAAESGYLGIISFVMLLLSPLIVAFRCGWRNRKDHRGDLLLGFGVALLIVYLHSFYEWVFVSFEIEYMFAATMGLVAGLAQELGYWRSARIPVIGYRSTNRAGPAAEAPLASNRVAKR